jgi:hypothetical protein
MGRRDTARRMPSPLLSADGRFNLDRLVCFDVSAAHFRLNYKFFSFRTLLRTSITPRVQLGMIHRTGTKADFCRRVPKLN